MNKFIIFFRTPEHKFYYLNKNNEAVEIKNPIIRDNKEDFVKVAKKFARCSQSKMHDFVSSNFKGKSSVCIKIDEFLKKDFWNIKSELSLLD